MEKTKPTNRVVNPMGVVEQLGHLLSLQHHLVGDLEVADVLKIQTFGQEPVEDVELVPAAAFRVGHEFLRFRCRRQLRSDGFDRFFGSDRNSPEDVLLGERNGGQAGRAELLDGGGQLGRARSGKKLVSIEMKN